MCNFTYYAGIMHMLDAFLYLLCSKYNWNKLNDRYDVIAIIPLYIVIYCNLHGLII